MRPPPASSKAGGGHPKAVGERGGSPSVPLSGSDSHPSGPRRPPAAARPRAAPCAAPPSLALNAGGEAEELLLQLISRLEELPRSSRYAQHRLRVAHQARPPALPLRKHIRPAGALRRPFFLTRGCVPVPHPLSSAAHQALTLARSARSESQAAQLEKLLGRLALKA